MNKYYVLTIRRGNDKPLETLWIDGSISNFLLIERELGCDTHILHSVEITEDEYETAIKIIKQIKIKYL